ncbi:hypothetical protein RclHR1_09140002 [Rhizophagus clarus]|uniref:Uncharacterized protein n=1 Tax=Rhizophagus clarus TaxID=94130 RepID=A0A2Z6SHR4_9GLOM|nr:hypothetical protein RclHR1_09140002 [Rhizophagus clarus]GES85028.1 hypothetical protein GLOIN_2v1881101 [Rhizophagus clarus]
MVIHALIVAPKAVSLVYNCLTCLKGLKILVKKFKGYQTSATITVNNKHQDMKLINAAFFSLGEIEYSPGLTIGPGETPKSSKFISKLGKFTSQGMISYKILGQFGANWMPLYLIVTWKVKATSGENSISINVREYGTPPLSNKSHEEKYRLFKELHKKRNRTYPGVIAKWDSTSSFFSVSGQIDNRREAEIVITFDHNYKRY